MVIVITRGDVTLASKLLCHHSGGIRAVEENKAVTCLQRCHCLDLPWAFCVKDALINLPGQLPPGNGLRSAGLVESRSHRSICTCLCGSGV